MLEDPVMADSIGNLALHVQQSITSNAAGENLLFKEGISKKMERLRQDLSGKDATPLERLLVDRIVLCWLILHDAELRFAQAGNLSIGQAEYWQNRIDRAHRRHLSAIKTLATVRKLAIPVLQVNIAKRQTNIAAGVSATIDDETKNEREQIQLSNVHARQTRCNWENSRRPSGRVYAP